mgnify:CR=1 FL=1
MAEKDIEVRICAGTTCHVFGGADLLMLEERLPEDVKERCSISGAVCLGLCKDEKNGPPPFALINGRQVRIEGIADLVEAVRETAARPV